MQNEDVRLLSTNIFASLLRLVPLDGTTPEPDSLPLDMSLKKAHEKRFLDQLTSPDKLEEFPIFIRVEAELRGYQRSGVNWLAFLNKYKLHGILCDDMGLGKTLQTVIMLASDHFEWQKRIRMGDHR